MEILINKNEKIHSDDASWIFAVQYKKNWQNKWYYPDLKTCYLDLLDYFTKKEDKNTLIEACEAAVQKLDCIKKEIQKKA